MFPQLIDGKVFVPVMQDERNIWKLVKRCSVAARNAPFVPWGLSTAGTSGSGIPNQCLAHQASLALWCGNKSRGYRGTGDRLIDRVDVVDAPWYGRSMGRRNSTGEP
jgi:hypothetical protein